jgi:small subunit ribosomal protein S17
MAAFCATAIHKNSAFLGTGMSCGRPASAPARTAAAFIPVRAAQSLQGKVVSVSGEKTAVVSVATLYIHPVYQKRIQREKKYVAHVDSQKCNIGDLVILAPCRPMSKKKRFVVDSILKAAQS